MKLSLKIISPLFLLCVFNVTTSNDIPSDIDIFGEYFANPGTPATPYTPFTPLETTSLSTSTDDESNSWMRTMDMDWDDLIDTDEEIECDDQVDDVNIFTNSLEENQKKLKAIIAFRKKHLKTTCCDIYFPNIRNLSAHYTQKHCTDGKYECAIPQCDYKPKAMFDNAFAHFLKHTNPTFLHCPVLNCNRDLSTVYKLKNHFKRCSLGIRYKQKKKESQSPDEQGKKLKRSRTSGNVQTIIKGIYASHSSETAKKIEREKADAIAKQMTLTSNVNQAQKQPLPNAPLISTHGPHSKLPRKLRTILKGIHTAHGLRGAQQDTANTVTNATNEISNIDQPDELTHTLQHTFEPEFYVSTIPAPGIIIDLETESTPAVQNNTNFAVPAQKTSKKNTPQPATKKVIPSKKFEKLPLVTKQPNENLRAILLARINNK